MRKTKKQLEVELKTQKKMYETQIVELHKEMDTQDELMKEYCNRYEDKCDRNKIVAYYLQVLRVMQDKINCRLRTEDFDRMLDVLGQDRYPEGF